MSQHHFSHLDFYRKQLHDQDLLIRKLFIFHKRPKGKTSENNKIYISISLAVNIAVCECEHI